MTDPRLWADNFNTAPVPDAVKEKVALYFKASLPDYKCLRICRKSNHIEDRSLYEVIAYNAKERNYAAWTTWNDWSESLGGGHYGLTFKDAVLVAREYFNNITGGYDWKGPMRTMIYINPSDLRRQVEVVLQGAPFLPGSWNIGFEYENGDTSIIQLDAQTIDELEEEWNDARREFEEIKGLEIIRTGDIEYAGLEECEWAQEDDDEQIQG